MCHNVTCFLLVLHTIRSGGGVFVFLKIYGVLEEVILSFCFAVASRSLWMWGWGARGQLGQGDTRNLNTPSLVEIFK